MPRSLENLVWSTDPDTEKRLHALQAGVPLVAAQYGAKAEVNLQAERINLVFPDGTSKGDQVECWSRISHMLEMAGICVE